MLSYIIASCVIAFVCVKFTRYAEKRQHATLLDNVAGFTKHYLGKIGRMIKRKKL